jgi:transposase
VVGVEQWAEVRRMHRVDGLSIREISKRTGCIARRSDGRSRSSGSRAMRAAETPPRYARPPAASKLDPFRDWIGEQLEADPRIQSQRLREMAAEVGYRGGKTIFDDYVREVRPRFVAKRTFQRTVYRPGELVQCDLWEPRAPIAVGHGQTRRGWVVTAELCWSRVSPARWSSPSKRPTSFGLWDAACCGSARCRRSS